MFVLETGLEETDNAALGFASTDEENVGLATLRLRVLHAIDKELVGRNERNAAPGEESATGEVYNDRRHATAGAFTGECGNSTRVGEEEGRFLPNLGDEFVEIVRSRAAVGTERRDRSHRC